LLKLLGGDNRNGLITWVLHEKYEEDTTLSRGTARALSASRCFSRGNVFLRQKNLGTENIIRT